MSGCFKADGVSCICDDCMAEQFGFEEDRETIEIEDVIERLTIVCDEITQIETRLPHGKGCWKIHTGCLIAVAIEAIDEANTIIAAIELAATLAQIKDED